MNNWIGTESFRFTLKRGQRKMINLHLPKRHKPSFCGRVFDDDSGRPLKDVCVTARCGNYEQYVKTDHEGRFQLTLPHSPVQVILTLHKPGYEKRTTRLCCLKCRRNRFYLSRNWTN